jgi:hypothetical protein
LPGRELIIERGDLVQPIDDLLVDHRSCMAPSPFAGLTQEQLAQQRMHTTQAVITRLESGRMKPSTRTLERLATATACG